MKSKSYVSVLCLTAGVMLAGCVDNKSENVEYYETPTVDYVERLNVSDAPHTDSFLHQLAMNYRSYATYNARTSGYPDIAELFAQKAVGAFSGETPFPETLDTWTIRDESERFEIYTAYNDLMNELKSDAADEQPQLAAEAQAKFDCWISAAASEQYATAAECKKRFMTTLHTLQDCSNGQVIDPTHVKSENLAPKVEEKYYPETRRLNAMAGASRSREGIVIVNNVNIPSNLIQPVPVPQQPMVFNQNIYGGNENMTGDDTINSGDTLSHSDNSSRVRDSNNNTSTNVTDTFAPALDDNYVSREEFIDMMLALRAELAEINARLDNKPAPSVDKTVIKVQQIPLEPKQRVMEEIFEIQFDFDKAKIKPEYDEIIQKLAETTQANKNVKVSVVGHTDTAGSAAYNYALGGRRAEAVQKMLIEYGIPASQIIAVSAGEEDLKVKTPNNTPNAANRRVRVVKETQFEERPQPAPIIVEEYSETTDCEDCE